MPTLFSCRAPASLLASARISTIIVIIFSLAAHLPAQTPSFYKVTGLGTLGGSESRAHSINNSGQVAGWSRTPGNTAFHAFRTAPNSKINPATDDLGTLGGTSSFAFGINSLGQVVGQSPNAANQSRAFRTAPNSAINPATDNLGTLGGSDSFARAINDLGQVVGWSSTGTPPFVGPHAFRTAPNSPINPASDDIGALVAGPVYSSEANGINNAGQVVGLSFDGARGRGFRTAPNTAINPATDNLGTLGGPNSGAMGINAVGQVVGYANIPSTENHGFRTAPNSPINPTTDDLGTFGGTSNYPQGINAAGQVVGSAYTDNFEAHAYVYSGSTLYDLHDLISPGTGWRLWNAHSINDLGQIVGWGFLNGVEHAFRLDPAPHPVQAINAVISQVEAPTLGLSNGEQNALIAQLRNALASFERGKIMVAITQLNVFLNQVTAMLRSGRISSSGTQPLIDAAHAIIKTLT